MADLVEVEIDKLKPDVQEIIYQALVKTEKYWLKAGIKKIIFTGTLINIVTK